MENYIEIYTDYKTMGMVFFFFFVKWNTKMKLKVETKIKLL